MPKRNWNDIDDSDSSLSSLSDQENAPTIEKQPSVPPSAASKLKNACDEMSLRKLQKHEGSEVWLYIPNSFYEMADEVDYTLERRQQLKKINRINLGWNVLTTKQEGRVLIEQGIAEERFFIKFIYSSKNEDRGMNNDQRPARLQKKVTYVEKNTKPAEKEEVAEQTKVEQKSSANEANGNKKKKWVEKAKSMNSEEVKSSINDQEEFKSPRQQEQKGGNNWQQTVKSPNKYAKEEIRSPRKFKEKESLQSKESTKTEPQTKEANQAKSKKSEAGSDSELSQQKEQRKKKKKKTQKKSKQPGKASKDQNPFSYFMQ